MRPVQTVLAGHFQNWFEERLKGTGILFDKSGRNSYPDFALVEYTEGYEIKGLAWPGRESTYDCNSQVPTGWHNGRDVFYVFGRYPKAEESSTEYPVIDLVFCHGDFLNADHEYVHKNKSVKGFGRSSTRCLYSTATCPFPTEPRQERDDSLFLCWVPRRGDFSHKYQH